MVKSVASEMLILYLGLCISLSLSVSYQGTYESGLICATLCGGSLTTVSTADELITFCHFGIMISTIRQGSRLLNLRTGRYSPHPRILKSKCSLVIRMVGLPKWNSLQAPIASACRKSISLFRRLRASCKVSPWSGPMCRQGLMP